MLEVIQGEGGVHPLSAEYIKEAAVICAERDWLLLIDEVQTGIGRTGKWFAFQNIDGIKPDAVSFAKGIAGGLPLGGFIVNEKCDGVLKPGDHAATFGGNLVCCAAAVAVLDIIEKKLPKIKSKGKKIAKALKGMKGLSDVRGKGLMIGATVDNEKLGSSRDLVSKLLENGLVCLTAGPDALRLMRRLVVKSTDIDEALGIIENACGGLI
jgi:acetylornithine/N-succinyldiaminopimelate aminotransferase